MATSSVSNNNRFDAEKLYGPGAKWRGSVHGSGEVTYEFVLQIPSIPPAVIASRQELNLGPAIWARTAKYSCPSLQLKESVVVSSDEYGRILLQSLIKPELGKLCLRQYTKNQITFLLGGDADSWTESDPPEVEVSLLRSATTSDSSSQMSHNNSSSSLKSSDIQNSGASQKSQPGTNIVSGPISDGPKLNFLDHFSNSTPENEVVNQFVYAAAHGNLTDMQTMSPNINDEETNLLNATLSDFVPLKSVNEYATIGPFSGCTALQAASENGRIKVVTWLLDVKKADVNLVSKEGIGVMHYACNKLNSNIMVVEKLLACRADPNFGFESVCTRGDDKVLECLLNWQTSANRLDDCIRQTAKNGHGKCLVMLLSMQKYRNEGVLTQALHLACISGKTSTVKILLSHQADPYKQFENENVTALKLAELHERDKVVEIIKNHIPARKPGRNILAELNGRIMT